MSVFDSEQLRKDWMNTSPNKGEARERRFATLDRLAQLGITREVIGTACATSPATVASWYRRANGPGSHNARVFLDRTSVIIDYMEDELGLHDSAIANFLMNEPRVPLEEQRDWIYDRWIPSQQAYEEAPIIVAIGNPDGPEVIANRMARLFVERQVEEQASVVATPETVR